MPLIQHNLQLFKEAWNHHGLRTASHRSPLQLWLLNHKEGQDFSQVKHFLDHVMYTILCPASITIFYPQYNGLNTCIPFVFQVDEDYGVDWEGPHTPCASFVSVPEIQLLRPFSEHELASLPNCKVPFSKALAVYIKTVQTLKGMLNPEP